MTTETQPSPLVLINCKQVTAITTLSKTAIYARLIHNPKRPNDYDPAFPKPVRIGAGRIAFVLAEVEAWVAGKIQASRKTDAQ